MVKHLNLISLTFISTISLTLLTNCNKTSFEDKLKSIDGISNVTKLENSSENRFKDKYLFEITQPIDWFNPSLGTFNQRVFLSYAGDNNINEYFVPGYFLKDINNPNYFKTFNGNEITEKYDCNVIEFEYRFFGKSIPDGFDPLDTKLWSHLTCENACKDFHNLISKLKPILNNKNIFTGGSKGGLMTETMAYFFPDDCEVFVSYGGPFSLAPNDNRMFQFLYEKVGDEAFGTEEAKKKRDIMLNFQLTLLNSKYRNIIQPTIFNKEEKPEYEMRFTEDELYEIQVLDYLVGEWEYFHNFDEINAALNMPENATEELQAKCDELKRILLAGAPYISKGLNVPFIPYGIQAFNEIGNYHYDFYYLRKAGADVSFESEEDELKILYYRNITEEQVNIVNYSPNLMNRMTDFYKTTKKDVIKLLGLADAWYSLRGPEVDNPHIHVFKTKTNHTSCRINNLDETQKNNCWSLISNLLGIK